MCISDCPKSMRVDDEAKTNGKKCANGCVKGLPKKYCNTDGCNSGLLIQSSILLLFISVFIFLI